MNRVVEMALSGAGLLLSCACKCVWLAGGGGDSCDEESGLPGVVLITTSK